MPRATAAPPVTASEPPSQKSFCTSTMISARMAPTLSSSPLLADLGGGPAGDPYQLGERRREHGVRVTGGGPDHVVLFQPGVDQGADRGGVPDRADAADGLAGPGPDRARVRPLHGGGADEAGGPAGAPPVGGAGHE